MVRTRYALVGRRLVPRPGGLMGALTSAARNDAGGVDDARVSHDVKSGPEANMTSTSDGVAPSATAIQ
jgi:hypothetical protein